MPIRVTFTFLFLFSFPISSQAQPYEIPECLPCLIGKDKDHIQISYLIEQLGLSVEEKEIEYYDSNTGLMQYTTRIGRNSQLALRLNCEAHKLWVPDNRLSSIKFSFASKDVAEVALRKWIKVLGISQDYAQSLDRLYDEDRLDSKKTEGKSKTIVFQDLANQIFEVKWNATDKHNTWIEEFHVKSKSTYLPCDTTCINSPKYTWSEDKFDPIEHTVPLLFINICMTEDIMGKKMGSTLIV